MMTTNRNLVLLGGVAFAALVILSNALFVVPETRCALILQFREIVHTVDKPGLHIKIPFIQTVEFVERRVLSVDAPPQEIMLAEQKPLEVDAFARYRIVNPLLFFQRLRSEDVARDRLGSMLNATLRSVLGTVKMATILSAERVDLMGRIRDRLNEEAEDFGLEIVDVRLRRTNLPQKTSDAVFARMRSQREQEAAQLRATGQQEALERTVDADREAAVIVAEAEGKAEKIRGEGDRMSLQLLADAAGRNPDFYRFWRALAAYRESLTPDTTTFVLSSDNAFLKTFRDDAQGASSSEKR